MTEASGSAAFEEPEDAGPDIVLEGAKELESSEIERSSVDDRDCVYTAKRLL
jgi:hypothetical protein